MTGKLNKKISDKIGEVFDILNENMPQKISFLYADEPWQFLIMVMLTAQCTDKKVMAQKDIIFSKYRDLKSIADANIEDIENSIKTLGLYKVKAKNMKATAKLLIEKYNGIVPEKFDDLLTFPGVGRKTANCIRGELFGLPAVICDTHFIRLMNRLGIASTTNAEDVEKIVSINLEEKKQYRFSMVANYFARNFCKSVSPECKKCDCILSKVCNSCNSF